MLLNLFAAIQVEPEDEKMCHSENIIQVDSCGKDAQVTQDSLKVITVSKTQEKNGFLTNVEIA